MKKNDYPTKEVFICECSSTEHQLVMCYIPGDDECDSDMLQFQMHLQPTYGFWKRTWAAIRYIFGYRSRFGNWDDFLVDPKDCDKIIDYLLRLKHDDAEVKANLEKKYNQNINTVK